MKHGAMLINVSVAFVASLTIVTSSPHAEETRPGQSDGHHQGHVSPRPPTPSPFMRMYAPLPFNPRPIPQRPFVPSAFGSSLIVVPSPVVPSLPMGLPYGSDQSIGYSPDQTYGPPEGMLMPPPPSAPPAPSVMQYPNGRYELRGDGMTSPYVWVWIPNPPPAPPAAPPSMPGAPVAPPVATRQSPVSDDLYSFVDDQGVLNWTDRWDSIPEKYRSRAKRLHL
jgi:hypothetical protein